MTEGEGTSCSCLEVAAGATVESVLNKLNIPESVPKIFTLNGVVTHSKASLKQGDVLNIFPPVAGG